jgi:hypothetical protein
MQKLSAIRYGLPSRIDAKCGDHFPVLIRTMPNWIVGSEEAVASSGVCSYDDYGFSRLATFQPWKLAANEVEW